MLYIGLLVIAGVISSDGSGISLDRFHEAFFDIFDGLINDQSSLISKSRSIRSTSHPETWTKAEKIIEDIESLISQVEEQFEALQKDYSNYKSSFEQKAEHYDRECGHRISEKGQKRVNHTLHDPNFSIKEYCQENLPESFQNRYEMTPRKNMELPDDYYCIPEKKKSSEEVKEVLKCYCIDKFYTDELD